MRYVHPIHGGGEAGGRKPEKFPRPEIKLDSSAEDWEEFKVTWEQYKAEYSLAGAGMIRQLVACCSEEMRQSLSRLTGGKQFTLTETFLLGHIKQLAVRYQNPAVFVQEFLSLSQQQDEGVRHYLTRLRGLASRCDFSVQCGDCQTDISYADKIIKFKLIAGLVDQEIKEDVLSNREERTLDSTVKEIEAKESGKLARRTVGATTASKVHVTAVNSASNAAGPGKSCGNCGRYGHSSQQADREKNCPAFNKTCNKCKKRGHFGDMCRSSKKAHSVREDSVATDHLNTAFVEDMSYKPEDFQCNSLSFGEIAALHYSVKKLTRDLKSINKIKIPHMLQENLKWIVRRAESQPMIKVSLRVSSKSYIENGIK